MLGSSLQFCSKLRSSRLSINRSCFSGTARNNGPLGIPAVSDAVSESHALFSVIFFGTHCNLFFSSVFFLFLVFRALSAAFHIIRTHWLVSYEFGPG